MLFNSFEFVIFLSAFLAIYYNTQKNKRWLVVLVGSYIFYMAWNPAFALLIMTSTVVDYYAGLKIGEAVTQRKKIQFLLISLSVNLGMLFTFKYLDFFIANILHVSGFLGWQIDLPYAELLLPVGISFYTFQTLSYTIDVYRGQLGVERHFGRFAAFVAFFPQLVAGPIERASNLLPQINHPRSANYQDIRSGLLLIAWGLWKKVCIADLIAPFVNGVFSDPTQYNGTYLLLATMLFAIQIYCDFSGYSDIARGVARLMGYDLMVNFRQPYFSTSLAEFWRRWHISLSSWFRDYVYIPLGGNRGGLFIWSRNILLVFLLSGIWHGAAWTFAIWGLLHGLWLLIEIGVKNSLNRLGIVFHDSSKAVRWVIGLLITNTIVMISWVFFRANNLDDAIYIINNIPNLGPLNYGTFKLLGLPSFELLLAAIQILILLVVDFVMSAKPVEINNWWERSSTIRWASYVGLFYAVALYGVFDKIDFIYFQF